MKANIVISAIIVSIVILGLLGLGFGVYWFFFAQENLFDLEAEEVISITLKKDGVEQAVAFDSQEDIEWFVSKLNAIECRGADINHSVIRMDDTQYSIYIEGANGGGYQLGAHRIRQGNKLYNLTNESKKIVKEIIAKFPKELKNPSSSQTNIPAKDVVITDTKDEKAEKYAALPLPEKVTLIHTGIGYSKEEDITVIEITDKDKVRALYNGLKYDTLKKTDYNNICGCHAQYYLDFHNGYAMLFCTHDNGYCIGEKVERKETTGGVAYYLEKDEILYYTPSKAVHELVMSYFEK